MPEGPEVATSRDSLRKLVVNNQLKSISIHAGRYLRKMPEGWADFLEDSKQTRFTIGAVDTKGKFMWWTLKTASQTWWMWCTHGMSGQWTTQKPDKNTAVVVWVDVDGSGLLSINFRDPRRFGTIKFVNDPDVHAKKLASLGPCVLSQASQVTPGLFEKKMRCKPGRTIAEALLDQSGVSGVGNYIKCEALWAARIGPWRSVDDITPNEYKILCESVLKIAKDSYTSQGATIKSYKTIDGSTGSAQFAFQMYGKKAGACGHAVRRETTADKRTSWWCTWCQK